MSSFKKELKFSIMANWPFYLSFLAVVFAVVSAFLFS